MLQNPHVLLAFYTVHNPLRLPRETRSERPKVVRTPSAFNILTWKCASRHSGVHFFDISTSKSDPKLVCFVHFHLEMCFAPQRRALLRHLNFIQKVVRTWCVLYILTWKCASHHTGVHFFDISSAKSGPHLCALCILTWKCASRHNGVHFFDILSAKSGPHLVCFVHFDLEMCFAPQRCALFQHLNFQKWSERGVFCTF